MGRCLAMGWGSVITGGGWGPGAVQGKGGVEKGKMIGNEIRTQIRKTENALSLK